MKKKGLVKLIALIVVLNTSMAIYAQNESIVVNKTVEDSIDYNYHRKYEYLNYNLIGEKSLLKIGARYIIMLNTDDNLPYEYCTLAITMGYERKLSPSLSWQGEIRAYQALDSLSTIGLSLHGKYYFKKNKEIKNNIGADNFFGSYVQFGVQDFMAYRYDDWRDTNKRKNRLTTLPTVSVSIGQQLLLTQWLYFDYNIYTNYCFKTDKFSSGIEGTFNFVIRGKKKK